jgi:hypothetical protein
VERRLIAANRMREDMFANPAMHERFSEPKRF